MKLLSIAATVAAALAAPFTLTDTPDARSGHADVEDLTSDDGLHVYSLLYFTNLKMEGDWIEVREDYGTVFTPRGAGPHAVSLSVPILGEDFFHPVTLQGEVVIDDLGVWIAGMEQDILGSAGDLSPVPMESLPADIYNWTHIVRLQRPDTPCWKKGSGSGGCQKRWKCKGEGDPCKLRVTTVLGSKNYQWDCTASGANTGFQVCKNGIGPRIEVWPSAP